jgi:hypothetical protein
MKDSRKMARYNRRWREMAGEMADRKMKGLLTVCVREKAVLEVKKENRSYFFLVALGVGVGLAAVGSALAVVVFFFLGAAFFLVISAGGGSCV